MKLSNKPNASVFDVTLRHKASGMPKVKLIIADSYYQIECYYRDTEYECVACRLVTYALA